MRTVPVARTKGIAHRSLSSIALALTAVPFLAAQSHGQDAPPSLEEMAKRLEALEKRNNDLEGEVKTLREADGNEWLSQERAAQIRELVQDTLADADSRASLQASGMTAGWDNGFFLTSPDGRFLLQVGGLIQTRYIYGSVREVPIATGATAAQLFWGDAEQQRGGFDMPGTELWFQGHVFGPGLTYKLKTRFSNDDAYGLSTNNVKPTEDGSGLLTLEDAWIRMELNSDWYFRAGQFRLPFSREELIDRQNQLAVDRSVINYSLSVGYSQGLELAYVSDLFRWHAAYSDGGNDQVGGQLKVAGGTNPANRPWNMRPVEWALTSRLEFKPYGAWNDFDAFTSAPGQDFGLMFGFGAHWQSTRPDRGNQPSAPTANRGDNEWLMMTVDASVNFGGANLFGAFTWSYADAESAFFYADSQNFNVPNLSNLGATNKWGTVVQGGFYVTPKVELFGRWELGMFSVNNENRIPLAGGLGSLYAREDHLNIVTTGVNWYIDGQDVKFTADFGYALNSVGPSWFAPQAGWRVTDVRDQWVARLMFQVGF
jgi:hypothetical protein